MKLIRPITIGGAGAFSRASTATYYDKTGVLQTAAIDVPRLNYDPSDLTKPPAWMLETAATNLLIRSQEFDNAAWTKTDVTVTPNLIAAPDGTTTADLITEGTTLTATFNRSSAVTPGAVHTGSVHFKRGNTDWVRIRLTGTGSNGCNAWVNLATGALGMQANAGAATLTLGRITELKDGWHRAEVSGLMSTDATIGLQVMSASGDGSFTRVSGATYYVWGAQLEAGGKATSYVPTVAATVARAADVNTLGLLSNIPEPDAGDPAAWTSTTLYVTGTQARTAATHEVFEAALGGATGTVTFTSGSATASVNWTAHGLANGTTVAFMSTGALPAELTAGQSYYVVSAAANTFGVSATVGGSGISLSGVGSGTHTAQPNPNYGKDPTLAANAAYWTRVGPTNRWAMFDQLSNTDSAYADVVAVNIDLAERIDSLGLLNISASKVRVIVTDAADGVVYDETYGLVSTDGIDDAWAYCFEPIERDSELILEDLPPYYGPNIQIVLAATGETASCGMCIPGLSYTLGGTQYGARVGIQDYSVKSTDDFGNIEITPRSYAKRGSFSMRFPKSRTDSVVKNLTEYRTTPALWLGHGDYGSTAIFGFYKDFNVLIDKLSHSLCEIEIEGLT